MNILVADKDKLNVNLLEYLEEIEPSLKIFDVSNTKDGLMLYKNNTIDFVIIDFSVNDYDKLLAKIIKINKYQKTITISESLSYSEKQGCDFCIQNHHRIRLLKPINIKELRDAIQNFDNIKCKYFRGLENIEDFIPDIERRYVNFIYDKDTKQIKLKKNNINSGSARTIQELVDITDNLNQFNVKYNIVDEDLIQLL